MGKKESKKINRRLKRSARKTVGVLTLIMAIIVAAIPTPSARAEDPSSGESGTQSSLEPPVYPEEADIPFPSVVPPASSSTTYQAQLIYKSGGTYYLFDVFDYYMQGSGNNEFGCISSYNDAYQPENGRLEIPSSVVHDYPAFTEQEVVSYFTTNRNVDLRDDDLERYYKSEWDRWQKYLADKAIWDALTPEQQASGRYTNPGYQEKPSHTVGEFLLSGEQWVDEMGLRYFCAHFSGTYASSNGGRININLSQFLGNSTEYTLMMVTDERFSDAQNSAIRYIPCKVGASVDNNKDYSSEFYCPPENACHIRYIGEEAFLNATSITRLEIPKDILAIGDRAFMGCSGLTTISAYAGKIGNRAFKGCASLTNVTLGDGVSEIGTECFYGCNQLASISFPGTMEKIGVGAFAYCMNLSTIKMDEINTNVVLGNYCYFDCPSISSVTFAPNTSEIGDAVFAITDDVPLRSTAWRNVVFPDNAKKLGEYILYGRWNIETVVMPAAFGTNRTPAANNVLGKGFFGKCQNLQYVE
ncbi:MAG: leucine-rich repeat domain-containing protein, partial [Lachnospiraceae bacterium]|nr:leucine-rich repeat domain-containing protein [Lachnospiraceae bacterium]